MKDAIFTAVEIFLLVALIEFVFASLVYSIAQKRSKKIARDPRQELCVICHEGTGCLKETPIKERLQYVGGTGQLCGDCYEFLYCRVR